MVFSNFDRIDVTESSCGRLRIEELATILVQRRLEIGGVGVVGSQPRVGTVHSNSWKSLLKMEPNHKASERG